MSRGGRSHAWLPRPKGAPGEPFQPTVGEVYLVDTIVFTIGCDPAAARPAVVVVVPADPVSRFPIQIVTRTSQQQVPGIPHPADPALKLDRDGVFSDLASVEQQLWRPENVQLLGKLPEPFLSDVLERFTT